MPDENKPLDAETITEPATGEAQPEPIPGGFFNPQLPTTKPEGMSWGDWMLKPGRPLRARHKKLAELIALGKTTSEIARILDYTEQRVSVLRSNTQISQEVDRIRDRLFSATVQEQLHALGPDAVSTIEEVLHSETEKLSTRADTARWVLEKLTGKARQEVGVEAGASLMELIQKLDSMKLGPGQAEPGRDVIEVTANSQAAEDDWMDKWLEQNVPGVANEKSEEKK